MFCVCVSFLDSGCYCVKFEFSGIETAAILYESCLKINQDCSLLYGGANFLKPMRQRDFYVPNSTIAHEIFLKRLKNELCGIFCFHRNTILNIFFLPYLTNEFLTKFSR